MMRVAVVLPLLIVLLGGCSTISGWFGGDDNAVPPAELEAIPDPVQLKELWSRGIGVGYDKQSVNLVPTVSGSYVLAADRDGRVVEMSAETGKKLWETKTDAPISAGPGAGEGLVLVGTSDAEVLALSIDDGAIVWRTQVSSEVLAVPRIDLGVVVIQTADGAIAGLSSSDGRQLWISDHSVPVLTLRGTSSPAVERGAVVAGFANGKVAALTTLNGFQVWETSISIPQGRSELDRLVDVDANPIIAGETVYVVSFQGKIAIIDLRSGNLGWTRDMSSYAGLGVDFSQIYVTDVDSKVWALSRDNGAAVWKQEKLHNRALTAPVPFGSYVAVGDFEGYLHLLSTYDGRIAGRVKVDSKGIAERPLVVGDVIFVYGKGGTLAAYTLGGG
jgi:outer membrane protein assembly factor BamB